MGDSRGGQDDLPDHAPHEIHLAHDHGHDLHRRDRQRGAEKQRGNQPLARIGQHGIGQHSAERDAAGERDEDAHEGCEHGGSPGLAHEFEIGFHAGQQQQKKNAELRDRVDHRLLFWVLREQFVLNVWQQKSEKRWSEQQSCDQLAHHRRQLQPQHAFAEQPADNHQRQDLCDEDDLGRAFRGFPRGEGGLDCQHDQCERQAEPAAADLGHRWCRPHADRRFKACNNPRELGKFQQNAIAN